MARPVLLNSCARAATAAEAGFRVEYPIAPSRATRVVALDAESEPLVRDVARSDWNSTRFYSVAGAAGLLPVTGDEASVPLDWGLDGVDAVILVGSTGAGVEAARGIGRACAAHGVMTVGLIVSRSPTCHDALVALRPYARILIHPADHDDLHDILRAMRA